MTASEQIVAPQGFRTHAGSIGIKDDTADYSVLASTGPCAVAGVFTQSLFAGPSVLLCRERLARNAPRAIVTAFPGAPARARLGSARGDGAGPS